MDAGALGRKFYELGLSLGGQGTVLIGRGGGPLAEALARCAGCGAALAGGEVRFHDGSCAACGVWLAGHYQIPAALFVRQDGEAVEAYLSDERGRCRTVDLSEKGKTFTLYAPAARAGEWDLLAGADCAWASRRAGEWTGERGSAWARGPAALTLALERLGYEVADRPVPGAVLFESDREGFTLRVDNGQPVCPAGEDALAALAEYARYPRAVPAFRPTQGEKTEG